MSFLQMTKEHKRLSREKNLAWTRQNSLFLELNRLRKQNEKFGGNLKRQVSEKQREHEASVAAYRELKIEHGKVAKLYYAAKRAIVNAIVPYRFRDNASVNVFEDGSMKIAFGQNGKKKHGCYDIDTEGWVSFTKNPWEKRGKRHRRFTFRRIPLSLVAITDK
ncbi:hypothetical protein HGB24_01540 [Candidatus Saccharibacteria bacterium]|nr:hypothetical protein [Candidatus Saccharibacteria bacterium]